MEIESPSTKQWRHSNVENAPYPEMIQRFDKTFKRQVFVACKIGPRDPKASEVALEAWEDENEPPLDRAFSSLRKNCPLESS